MPLAKRTRERKILSAVSLNVSIPSLLTHKGGKVFFFRTVFLVACFLLWGLSIGTFSAHPQEQGERIALVIGNGNYEGMGKLANPVNDAEDMGETLSELGFDVEVVTDAGLEQMEEAVLRFRDKLAASPGSVGVFFYAGHGVQSGGENYLIPVDARINSESLLRTRAVPLQFVLDSLKEARNKVNIVILDACRDNPFSWARSSSRGLAVVGQQPPGSIVVYSTSAGRVAQDGTGRNSVFTEELIQHLRTPGIDISEVLRRTGEAVQSKTRGEQIPAVYSQFFGFLTLAEEGLNEEEYINSVISNYLPPLFDEAPRDVQFTIAWAEERAQSGQRLDGWNTLVEADPSHSDPYLVAAKIRFLLEYGEAQEDHLKFTFYNTGDKDYDTALQAGTLEQKRTDFDLYAVTQRFNGKPENLPPVLALELGKYYYRVYISYPTEWPLRKEEVLDQALSWLRIAETKGVLTQADEIVSYTHLLADKGKLDEAITFLRKKMEGLPRDSDDWARLWEALVDTYARGGKPREALKEIDTRIRSTPADAKDTLFSLYLKGIWISTQSKRKEDFERYVKYFEVDYPNTWYAGIFRHRFLLETGDYRGAQKLAERLYQQFPVESIVKDNILEPLLENYLRNPSTSMDMEGISFLDSLIKANQGIPNRLFELYMYRAAYRTQVYWRTVHSDTADPNRIKQIARESLADLDRAETLYRGFPSQEEEILSEIKKLRQYLQEAVNTGKWPDR